MDAKYSTINGDPDATRDKIYPTDIQESNDLDIDKSGRAINFKDSPIPLVTVMGQNDKAVTVFGNDLRNKNPCKMGGMFTLLFVQDQPLICIGPQCKFILSQFYKF